MLYPGNDTLSFYSLQYIELHLDKEACKNKKGPWSHQELQSMKPNRNIERISKWLFKVAVM